MLKNAQKARSITKYLLIGAVLLMILIPACSPMLGGILGTGGKGLDHYLQVNKQQPLQPIAQDSRQQESRVSMQGQPREGAEFQTFPTVTRTPSFQTAHNPDPPRIFMSENTFCRSGPGIPYDQEAVIYEGEDTETFAQDPSRAYFYVRNPDQPNQKCWTWGRYATPEPNTRNLPVYTPPPTPTPAINFSVSYISLEGPCFGGYALMYRINNLGGETLRSWKTEPIDYTGGSLPQDWYNNSFVKYDGCAVVNEQINLTPGNGESYYFVSRFAENPQGHDIATRLTVCTKDGLDGSCKTETIRHTP